MFSLSTLSESFVRICDCFADNGSDLYSKSDSKPDPVALRPYYEGLIAKYIPHKIKW